MQIPYLDLSLIHADIRPELDDAYKRVLERGWYIRGDETAAFEKEFAAYCGASACVGCGNGFDALRLILQGYGIGCGDEVIVPAHTFIATVLAVVAVGAKPVFVDADMRTYNLDVDKIEGCITDRTRAVIAVHLYGRAVPLEKLRKIGQRYSIKIIEDAAQAHGAAINGKKTGDLADAAAFSFYPGKNIGALGDAGAVVTNDIKLSECIRVIGNYGSREKYRHCILGCNSRLDELQAAFLRVKLGYLDDWNRERRKIANLYEKEIKNPQVLLPGIPEEKESHVFHIYPVLVEERERFRSYLTACGIGTNVHYPIPIVEQKVFADWNGRIKNYPVTERLCAQEVSLPLYPGMTEQQIAYVVKCVNEF